MKETASLAHPPPVPGMALPQAYPACLSLTGLLAVGLPCLEDGQQTHVPLGGGGFPGWGRWSFLLFQEGRGVEGSPQLAPPAQSVQSLAWGALPS